MYEQQWQEVVSFVNEFLKRKECYENIFHRIGAEV